MEHNHYVMSVVTWYREDKGLIGNRYKVERNLAIADIGEKGNGVYTWIATNKFGTAMPESQLTLT